jgi:hypothetical protein
MTNGRALPGRVVAEQEPFFITLGGPKDHDSSVEKHFQVGTAEPQISPLRCASVEMTKGRGTLPGRVVAEQEPFFITLGGPKDHDSSVEKHFQVGTAEPQISPLRCAPVEMTKGRGTLPLRIVSRMGRADPSSAELAGTELARGWHGSSSESLRLIAKVLDRYVLHCREDSRGQTQVPAAR